MSSGKTTLGFFKKLVLENGLDFLMTDFHQLANSKLRDSSKGYDEDNEAYYLFREHPDTLVISDESYPVYFENQLKNKIYSEIKNSLNKIDQQLERRQDVESVEKYLRFIKNDINSLIRCAQKDDTLSEYDVILQALITLKIRIKEISKSYNTSDSTDLINEFALEFTNSPRVKYTASSVERYIRNFEKLKSLTDFRAKIKSKLDDLDIEYPADQGLINWEKKWKEFQDSRTAN